MKYRYKSCESVLLIQGTGSGESSVPQTIGVIDGGATIIIEDTLSLYANQISKIDAASNKHKFIQSNFVYLKERLFIIKIWIK